MSPVRTMCTSSAKAIDLRAVGSNGVAGCESTSWKWSLGLKRRDGFTVTSLPSFKGDRAISTDRVKDMDTVSVADTVSDRGNRTILTTAENAGLVQNQNIHSKLKVTNVLNEDGCKTQQHMAERIDRRHDAQHSHGNRGSMWPGPPPVRHEIHTNRDAHGIHKNWFMPISKVLNG
jgi:hypothetical protein